jgi:hypothetical protein
MALWICFISAIVAGAIVGGRKSLSLARAGEFAKATRVARIGGVAAASCSMVALFLLSGWPFKAESVSVAEEIRTQWNETISVWNRSHFWFVPLPWGSTEQQTVPHENMKTVVHLETRREFSVGLLMVMSAIGCIAYLFEIRLIRLIWRWRG